MAICGSASWWAKLAFIFLLAAAIMHIVGWATPSWMMSTSGSTNYRVGLWNARTCTSGVCSESTVGSSFKTDKFRATQAMETIAFILFLIAPIALGIYVFMSKYRQPGLASFCLVLCFIIATFLLLGMIIWLVYVTDPWSVSYSFGFTIIALILLITAILFLFLELNEERFYWFDSRSSSTRDGGRGYTRNSSRSVSPYPSRSRSPDRGRTRTTALSDRAEYDRMPSPMTPEKPENSLTSRSFRPATYNNISNLSLQRDTVGYLY